MNSILEIIKRLENFAGSIGPVQLVISGIACLLFGLICWLAGLWLKRIFFPVAVMAGAVLVCYYLKVEDFKLTIIAAAAAFIITFILQFIFISDSMFWNLPLSLLFSVLGTILLFTGQILLLSFKGSKPVDSISQKQNFFAAVFAAMIAFGTVCQILFCSGGRKYLKNQPVDVKDKKQSQGE